MPLGACFRGDECGKDADAHETWCSGAPARYLHGKRPVLVPGAGVKRRVIRHAARSLSWRFHQPPVDALFCCRCCCSAHGVSYIVHCSGALGRMHYQKRNKNAVHWGIVWKTSLALRYCFLFLSMAPYQSAGLHGEAFYFWSSWVFLTDLVHLKR